MGEAGDRGRTGGTRTATAANEVGDTGTEEKKGLAVLPGAAGETGNRGTTLGTSGAAAVDEEGEAAATDQIGDR